MTTAHVWGIIASKYLLVTHMFPRFVYALKCSMYSGIIDVVHVRNVKTARTQVTCLLRRLSRQVGKCADRLSLLRQWRTCHHAMTDALAVLLFCDVHINIGVTLRTLLPRAVQYGDITGTASSYHMQKLCIKIELLSQYKLPYSLNALVISIAC